MNFENPVWLYLTPLIGLSAAGLIAFGLRRRDTLLKEFAAARLLDQLTEMANLQRILIKAALILLACTLIGIALARPQYGVDFIERKARGLDIVFVLDSSRSMLATDLKPTRLERARLAIMDLVRRLESDRIGLVVFAGRAFLQTPPTLDYSAFRENLSAVGPSSISRGGSNIGQALREAVKAFPKDDNVKVVVLLTDGEDLEDQAIDTAREVAKDGIKVYSIGIGTPEGTYLKVRTEEGQEEFVRDSSGQPVRSRLDETTLREISQLTGGSYSRLAGQSLEMLYASVLSTLPREERESELQETRIERYQWVLLAAFICLVVETLIRRRRTVPVQVIIVLILLNLMALAPSYAEEEPDQESGDEPVEAITSEKLSDDPRVIYNQAHAGLVAGDYTKALELYETAIKYSNDIELERNGLYNMAHASNQLGEEALQAQDFETAVDYWKKAEALFKSANELDPTDTASLEDAQKMTDRRKALEEFLNQQESQEQQQSSQEQQNDSNRDQSQQDSETESGENEQDTSEPSADDNSGEESNPQSDESSSEQNEQDQSENQEDGADQQSSGTKNSEDNKSGQSEDSAEESAEDARQEESSNNSSPESSQNPAEDMQEQDTEAASGEDEGAASETEASEAIEEASGQTDDSEATQKAVVAPQIMETSEAQLLLDSLRNEERLLPFTDSSDKQGQKGETRDW